MIVVIISWLLIFYMISVTGIVAKKSLKLTDDPTFILLYGIIFQTLFIGIFAFFYKIGSHFFITNCCLVVFASFFIRNELKLFISSLFTTFSLKSKVIFSLFIVLVALKSAQLPSIFDNETYYIQTIKWLNEFGYIKGIANVHPFLAQCSFWHVFQSGFNYSFISDSFNDVNGLLLIIGIYYFFQKYNTQPNLYLIVNSLFLVVYFQFIDAPSPDLPILVFLSIFFNEFIFNNLDTRKRKSLFLFLIFLVFIKLTIAPLLLLLYFILDKEKKIIVFAICTGLIFGITWIIKNLIITGYPLFPLSLFDFNFDWKLPIESMNYMYKNINNLGYAENVSIAHDYSLLEKLNFWIHLKGINGFFNSSIIILLFLTPFTKLYKSIKNFKILYFVLLIHFVFLLVTSPQYRFFLPTIICLGTVLIYDVLMRINFSNNAIIISLSILLINFSLFFDLKNISINEKFNINCVIYLSSNSKHNSSRFKEKSIGNFKFYDPNLPNLYETSNGKLPCVNNKLFEFYTFYPQQRTSNIKDGFYAKKIEDD
ncbi:LIC_10190 family membrane protein [Flavobacterium sp.]|uniref:LIC_10190 family membrane protein n=1 Tax=Flavobacterium sp. TaxID=239 RepID=UPI0040476950